jgi:hypothetical protein
VGDVLRTNGNVINASTGQTIIFPPRLSDFRPNLSSLLIIWYCRPEVIPSIDINIIS